MDINKAFPILVEFEGSSFTNAQGDKGGMTKYGISAAANPDLDIKNLTEDQARVIYQQRYWLPAHCDDVPGGLKYVLFDTAVNDGPIEAIKIVQHAAGISADGIWGNRTEMAVQSLSAYVYLTWRQKIYKMIIDNDPSQAKWFQGWTNRVTKLMQMSKAGVFN